MKEFKGSKVYNNGKKNFFIIKGNPIPKNFVKGFLNKKNH